MALCVCDRGIWLVRKNGELNNLYKNIDIVTDFILRQLEWLGHLIRMDSNIIPNTVLDANLEGKRKFGRPKLRWLDDVQTVLKMTGIEGTRKKAQKPIRIGCCQ